MAKQQIITVGGLGRFQLVAMLLTLLGIVLCAGLLFLQVTLGANNAHADAIQRQQAKAVAALLNGRYQDMRATLALHAASPAAVVALTSADPAARVTAAANIANAIPFAVRVDLVPLGAAQVDLNASVPINFAALDLIRRAESAEFVGPEAGAKPRDVVYTAAPVINSQGSGSGEGVAGVLFVAFSADYLKTAVAGVGDQLGLAQIEQTVDKIAPAIVLEYGTATIAALPIREPLQAPGWVLVYSSQDTANITSLLDLVLPLAAVLILGLGGIWLTFSRLTDALNTDSDALALYSKNALGGHVGKTDHFQINTFQNLAKSLITNLSDTDVKGFKGAASPSSSPGKADAATAAGPKSPEDLQDSEHRKTKTKGTAKEAAAAALLATTIASGAANADIEIDSSGAAAEDDFLDIGDDDDFDLDSDNSATGSFLQANLPEVSETVIDDENFGVGVEEILSAGPETELDPDIFRAYDIRGIVDTNLTPDAVYWIGRAFASQARSENNTKTIVGRDGRLSSPALAQQLIRGLLEGGMNVIDIGQVATPMLYFATHQLNTGTGVMITGSHNPPEYNGLKLMIGGETLAEERIQALRQRLSDHNLESDVVAGEHAAIVIDNDYVERILNDVAVAQSLKIVVDCGNGVAGGIAPLVLQELGCDVIPLYCEVDGTFPNHHPDPADPRNMVDLITVVKAEGADLGIAFDGDGDRIGVVTNTGEIIWPDKLMMLFARDIVGRNPGADIIYDVKCSRHLNNLIAEYGGRPIMWKTGHSHMKAKLKETGALLAGEFSGHVAFGERWYGFDDAIYTAARLLEIVGSGTLSTDQLFAEFPATLSTPELHIETTDAAKFDIINKLAQIADFGDGTVTSIDGLRVDYASGWGLIRASNTAPKLTLRFEADTESALDEVKTRFRTELAKVDNSLKF